METYDKEQVEKIQPEKARCVHIGQVGGNDQGRHGKTSTALEACLPQRRTDQGMGKIVHLPDFTRRSADGKHPVLRV